jgi:hypothetical protein
MQTNKLAPKRDLANAREETTRGRAELDKLVECRCNGRSEGIPAILIIRPRLVGSLHAAQERTQKIIMNTKMPPHELAPSQADRRAWTCWTLIHLLGAG